MNGEKGNDSSSNKSGTSHPFQILDIVTTAASLGITLAVCLILGVLAGTYIDELFGTTPWGLIVMSLLGAVTGFWSLYKKMLKIMDRDSERHKKISKG